MEEHPRVRYYYWDALAGVGLGKGRKMAKKEEWGSNVDMGPEVFWFPVNGG